MKIALLAALTLAAVSLSQATPIERPSLPLDKAAAIAQEKLEELKLPPEYCLRKMEYHPTSEHSPIAFYIATYEPPRMVRVEFMPGNPTPTRKLRMENFIYVFMDGAAKVADEQYMKNPKSVSDQ